MAVQRTTDRDGSTLTFVLTGEDPDGPISVVGSFNDWTPGRHSLEADLDGSRSVTVAVATDEDVYFRYLGPGGHWFDDPDADEITAEGSVLRAQTDQAVTEAPAEQATADQPDPVTAADETAEADAHPAPEPAEAAAPTSEPATHDETGELLEAVADRIDDARSAARDLVDHDAFEPGSTEVFDGHAPQPAP